eukprot:CAMPEP_0201553438 /NCGR_PEP_ID=MMETSP0173_2-20130828/28436_1 /ASSEMBLY_ACC=CAM_ASM_000268 /TAXON_ID=218659 /ORGANISM="Vexillifera sp., Strain DIVA3 564/2" /LENGTH=617 /DNA_ID=CAMNT_0047964229 /DNA_START=18 /DNA_END=1868 /DNA_ORIENTATION=+
MTIGAIGVGLLGIYSWLNSKTLTLHDDIAEFFRLIKYKRLFDSLLEQDFSTAEMFEESVEKFGDLPFINYIEDQPSKGFTSEKLATRVYSFREVNDRANQVANWALSRGIRQQEVVALMMDNRPEYLWTWIGLAKVGAIIALINTNLKGAPLVHSLTISEAKHFIIGNEHVDAVNEIRKELESSNPERSFNFYSHGRVASAGFTHLNPQLDLQSTIDAPAVRAQRKGISLRSTLFYIYTSGTTGPPKASIVKHFRFYGAAVIFGNAHNFSYEDNLYCTLPLYHASGGMIGVGLSMYSGATLTMRRKFSTSRFWFDIHQYGVTSIMYIGELCRYLVSADPTPYDRNHNVRIAVGNGLRPDVWKVFTKRFNVPVIGEFYGATEGNANMLNTRNKFGAVGYISPLISAVYPVAIVKVDFENELPLRNADGFCVRCDNDEVGELLGRIDQNDPTRSFHGYTNKKASSKKILCDVFVKGDAWFRTGDLLKKDKWGFYYFSDRIGDTFRWKGENVATSEVGEVLSGIPGVKEPNVYGVQIPHHDGRAGMALLVVDESVFSLDKFYQAVQELPSYAQPLFIRTTTKMDITGTFKHKKRTRVLEGFDPSKIQDKLYFRDDRNKTY